MKLPFLLGRVVFGGYFISAGVNHFKEREHMKQYAAAKGVPMPDVAVTATGAVLVLGGASILLGIKPKWGAAALIGFLAGVSPIMHNFWAIEDPQQREADMINFTKNMALVGAALTMMQIEEPWPIGVDDARAADEDMYVHLGGRELRALPA